MAVKIKTFSSILLFLSLFIIYLQITTSSAIKKGDKFLTDTDDDLSMRNGRIDPKYRWPNGILPFTIVENDFTKEQIAQITAVIRTFNDNSCVKIVVMEPTDTHWVKISGDKPGCGSNMGYNEYKSNPNRMNLHPPECLIFGRIAHEFLHQFGFEHMQSTWDRDDYVEVHMENVIEGAEVNFEKFGSDKVTSFGYPYDYDSVMHYERLAGSKNGKPTIEPINPPYAVIGQRTTLSQIDMKKLNAMYNCTDYL